MLKLRLCLVSLALAVIALAASPRAFAGTLTDLNFKCAAGDGLYAGNNTNLCVGNPVHGPNTLQPNFSEWTQGGFTVTSVGLGWMPNQGEVNNGNTPGQIGVPSLYGGSKSGLPGAPEFGILTITDGGAWFDFNSVDLKTTSGMLYTIKGYLGGNLEFTLTCGGGGGNPACPPANNTYITVNGENVMIDKLTITLYSGTVDYLDNIDLTSVPEPTSLLLFGTGLLGLAFAVRTRLAR